MMREVAAVIIFCLLVTVPAYAQAAPPGNGATLAVVRSVAPYFPPLAAQARITYVRFEVDLRVDRDGTPLEVRMRKPFLLFQPAVEAAARLWRFVPDDSVSERTTTAVFSFRLMPRGTPDANVTTLFLQSNEIEVRMLEAGPVTSPVR